MFHKSFPKVLVQVCVVDLRNSGRSTTVDDRNNYTLFANTICELSRSFEGHERLKEEAASAFLRSFAADSFLNTVEHAPLCSFLWDQSLPNGPQGCKQKSAASFPEVRLKLRKITRVQESFGHTAHKK
jgi:hypothetical protein